MDKWPYGHLAIRPFLMANIFLFTGENAFAVRQEQQRWVAEFIAKHGDENTQTVDGSTISLRELLDAVSAGAFIASKRLIVVQEIPKFSKEEMQALFAAVHPDCVLLFCDAAPDRRLVGFKTLQSEATVKQFPPLRGKQLFDWMAAYARGRGSGIEPAAAEMLQMIAGSDQEMLARELEKLALHAGAVITRSHIGLLAVPSGEQEVWQLTSLLSRGELRSALLYARTLLLSGEDPFSLWNILLWMLRSLTAVALCAKEGVRNPAQVAGQSGVPFPTVKTLLPMTHSSTSLGMTSLRALVDWAVESDRALKTGGYRATAEASQELLALIDALIIRVIALTEPSLLARHSRSA